MIDTVIGDSKDGRHGDSMTEDLLAAGREHHSAHEVARPSKSPKLFRLAHVLHVPACVCVAAVGSHPKVARSRRAPVTLPMEGGAVGWRLE